MAVLIITALIVGKSAVGLPNGGEGGGEDWVNDVEENHGCYCHAGEQLNEGMYSLQGMPNNYIPETTYNLTLSVDDTNVERSENDNGRYGGFLAEVSEVTEASNPGVIYNESIGASATINYICKGIRKSISG